LFEETVLIKKYNRSEHAFVNPRYKFIGGYYNGVENIYRSANPDFNNIPFKEIFWHHS